MKRMSEVSPKSGVYNYSTGQIGTSDLPVFIAEVVSRKHHVGVRQAKALARIKPPVVNGVGWRSQLAGAYAHLKQNAKRKH